LCLKEYKEKMRKTAILVGILVLSAILAIPAASAALSEYYLDPDDSSVPEGYCNTVEVAIWFNATENIRTGKVTIGSDMLCGDITSCTINTMDWPVSNYVIDYPNQQLRIGYGCMAEKSAGVYRIANFTIHCNSTAYCATDVLFSDNTDTDAETYARNNTHEIPTVTDNGTFECGTAPSAEDFSKPIYEGWNLISLPLVPDDNSVSTVLSTVSYDAVYRYNAISKQFESVDVMNPGTGYFVYATADCTWEYSGTAYSSVSTPLEPGLNMVGWLNCSKDIDTLSSISGDYYYVARWNTAAEKFEVYNPAAPSTFNDFTAMDRGTGYFISAKQDCTDCVLSENC
jgi:hypothetical protein